MPGDNVASFVSRDELDRVMGKERVDRRKELRRESDRVDQLRLDHQELRRVVIGKDGDNGLASRVKVAEHLNTRNERILWMILAGVFGLWVHALS